MFCAECGKELAADMTTCTACGTRTPTVAAAPSSEVGNRIKVRFQDALNVAKIVVVNPVGGLPVAFQSLERRQAMEVGIVFAVVLEVCAVVGLFLILPRSAGSPGPGDILKILILGVAAFAATTGACALARNFFRGSTGSIEGDVFIAGISVLPFGIVCLLAGILGSANFEVATIASVFSLSYTVLVLYTGCTRISGISEARAAPAVPLIVLITGWLSKILFAAML